MGGPNVRLAGVTLVVAIILISAGCSPHTPEPNVGAQTNAAQSVNTRSSVSSSTLTPSTSQPGTTISPGSSIASIAPSVVSAARTAAPVPAQSVVPAMTVGAAPIPASPVVGVTPVPATTKPVPVLTPVATAAGVPAPTARPVATASGVPMPAVTPVGQSGNWNLIFDDEFNGPTLDTTRWTTCYPWQTGTCTNAGNYELELYNPEDVLIDQGAGTLRLRAQKRDMVGWNGQTFHYTSGMVSTGGIDGQQAPSFSYTYGYAEARVKVPKGQGFWPAFWALPITFAWPPEIDVMEILGQSSSINNMVYHWTSASNPGDHSQLSTWSGPDFSAGYHVFGTDWTPTAIVWYVDGVERARYSQAANIYNQPMYLLLNLAVGGDWPGAPDASTPFPSYFDIDYVRVWQRAGG